jgi:dipeptidyl aminopeptidase/acylaminoacyl peptidase
MAAWAVTQTDRFQAASMGAGITNLYSMYGSHDIQSYLRAFFGNYPWRDPEEYARHSAMTFVDQVKTPVLIQHGEQDTRVPLSQAKEFYQALRDRGATVEFVVYPRQGHGVSEPKLMRDVMQRNVDWMDRWVLGKRVRKAK